MRDTRGVPAQPPADPSVPSDPIPATTDVLVVGAGPGGAAAATYAARAGLDVVLVDAARFPRDKTCGDGLTPRAVTELGRLGLGDWLDEAPRLDGLSLYGWGGHAQIPWPRGRFAPYGSAVRRTELDDRIRRLAVDAGVTMVQGAKAVDAEIGSAGIESVTFRTDSGARSIRPQRVIVADGVRSALGKALGRSWHRDTPYGVAARAYCESGRADDHWMGSHLELRGPEQELLAGYGWLFPLGTGPDGVGRLNIGVGTLATARRPADLALRPVLGHYYRSRREDWELSTPPAEITSALLPMGGAVSGVAGPNWMLIGDAAACVNPLNGEGIDYAIETGRLAVEALDDGDFSRAWPATLTQHYGLAFAAARRFATVLTMPKAVPVLGRPGIRVQALMAVAVRVMGNLMTEDDKDLVARAWRTIGRAATAIESRPPFH
jgi:geranylgeranyl reductase family protein